MMKKLFSDRKIMFLMLGIIVVSIMTVTLAYAALSVTLNIAGNAKVNAADWYLHFDNIYINPNSVRDVTIEAGETEAGFEATLNMPGDFVEFYADIKNDGSIDAMIESITKTPDLTAEQAKYLKYEVSYQNGDLIEKKQLVKKGEAVPIKVRVEYRKDVVASDLPTNSVVLELGIEFSYTQSDGSGIDVYNNGYPVLNVDGEMYEIEPSTTWVDWFYSPLNTCEEIFLDEDGKVMYGELCIKKDGSNVYYEDYIIGNYVYSKGSCFDS